MNRADFLYAEGEAIIDCDKHSDRVYGNSHISNKLMVYRPISTWKPAQNSELSGVSPQPVDRRYYCQLIRTVASLSNRASSTFVNDTLFVTQNAELVAPVSYTHLTLPTNREV